MISAEADRDKPGIGRHTGLPPGADLRHALRFSGARAAGQGLRPVDPESKRTPWFGIRLSQDLRDALEAQASTEQTSASCYVRTLLADHLAVEGPKDRVDGRRFVDADVAAACRLMDDVGRLVLSARELAADARRDGVLGALEAVHLRLVRLIESAEAVRRAAQRRPTAAGASHDEVAA